MKKICLCFLALCSYGVSFSCGVPSLYPPTPGDIQLLNSVYPKIDILFQEDYLRGNKIMMNIKDMSMNFDIASREYYILRELHLYMNEKINDTIEIPSYLSSGGTLHPYMLYSSMAYDAALAAGKTIVINFRASWCPRCKATSEEIIAHMSDIPSNVIVLEADYDGTKDLQDLYGVTMQTTFVFFDTAGNVSKKVEKLSGIDELLKELE